VSDPGLPEVPVRGAVRPLRIGLTGPIGCGKSTVAGWLGEHAGVVVIDADRVARDVLGPGTPEVEAVYRRFGEGLRRPDGGLDRSALARIVFSDPAALRDLEAIVHPAVRPRILAALAETDRAATRAVVIEAIKLVEGGLAGICDEVWLVTCDPAIQRERLVGRGADPADAAARIQAQGDIVGRLRPGAARIIDTSGPVEETRALAAAALAAALAVSPRA
jgi:dephospho-CoA kinase